MSREGLGGGVAGNLGKAATENAKQRHTAPEPRTIGQGFIPHARAREHAAVALVRALDLLGDLGVVFDLQLAPLEGGVNLAARGVVLLRARHVRVAGGGRGAKQGYGHEQTKAMQ